VVSQSGPIELAESQGGIAGSRIQYRVTSNVLDKIAEKAAALHQVGVLAVQTTTD
jgi:hypothetical protein